MKIGLGSYVVGLVIVVAVAAATFRISTAPERAQQRRDLARQTCVETGGKWLETGRDGLCRKPGDPQ